MPSIDARLEALGIALPARSAPAARYVNAVRVGNLLFLSGKGPGSGVRGRLGDEFTTEEGYRFARAAGIEALAALKGALGSLERVRQVVKLQGFVNAVPAFAEHHLVMDGASDLMTDVFGERGRHARSVLGASSLRDRLPVILEGIFEIDPQNLDNIPMETSHDIHR